jgi:outer membrane immunogenic protein
MKKLMIGCAAVAALFSLNATYAADLARPAPAPYYKAPVSVPPPFSWTGLYIGLEGGYGWGNESYTDNAIGGVSTRPEGGIFGGVLGYRYQIGQFVLGAEGTAAWADLNDTASGGGFSEAIKTRALYTATGQVGYAFGQALLYAKGGWASAYVHNDLNGAGVFLASNSQDANGWTVGAGLDYAVWQNVVLGVEYDHMDLGYGGFSTPTSLGGTWTVGSPSRFTIDQVVGRLTYKFNLF